MYCTQHLEENQFYPRALLRGKSGKELLWHWDSPITAYTPRLSNNAAQ